MGEKVIVNSQDGSAEIRIAAGLFSGDAVVRAAHLFTGTCHVQVSEEGGKLLVRIAPKSPEVDVKQIAADFHNALLDEQLRLRLREETGEIQKMIVAEAFAPLERPEQEQQA